MYSKHSSASTMTYLNCLSTHLIPTPSPNMDLEYSIRQSNRIQKTANFPLKNCNSIKKSLDCSAGTPWRSIQPISLPSQPSPPTAATSNHQTSKLARPATHPNAILTFKASDMHLWAHSDASYLSESKARSRCGIFYYLSSRPHLPINPEDPVPPINGPILTQSKIVDTVMSSAQEAETGAGFFNAQQIVPLRIALEELGHPQGPTPIQFDNKVATSILNDEVSQKRSKAMDMRFYWLRDRVKQKQFYVHWKRGTTNIADYYTKHHSPNHHKIMRKVVLPK